MSMVSQALLLRLDGSSSTTTTGQLHFMPMGPCDACKEECAFTHNYIDVFILADALISSDLP